MVTMYIIAKRGHGQVGSLIYAYAADAQAIADLLNRQLGYVEGGPYYVRAE